MKTIKINLYSYNELTENAKNRALENWRNMEYAGSHWQAENLESLKQGLLHFDFELTGWSIDYYCATNAYLKITGHTEDTRELSGVRLWKYLHNNNYLEYFCKYNEQIQNVLDGNCPFTGYCADECFLNPIRQFMKTPCDQSFIELMEQCCSKVLEIMEEDYQYQTSEDYLIEHCEANDVYFYSTGEMY